METVTISKEEYTNLLLKAKAYQRLASDFFKGVMDESLTDVVNDFRKTNLYTDDFLLDLEDGLKKSSYNKHKK